ncbi:Retrovirus-related Pol polyprotein from type-1 retrotransposable element R2 [Dictyocoela roeselum]|nr:Retrovirus-related Pol polyprotein from type-1 retrotransposable element R2 [Dictyocoela roeselum]
MERGQCGPNFKIGEKTCPGNCRLISLTSVIGKLMERLMTEKNTEFLESNKLIGESQHGFRQNRSSPMNLLLFFRYIIEIQDTKSLIDIIHLDFQKAFDNVPHRCLIGKWHGIGIRGELNNWIKCWLTDRRQRVVLNGASSPGVMLQAACLKDPC